MMSDSHAAKLLPRTPAEGVDDAYPLAETATVGRHPTNTIVLGLDSISRFHARIDRRGKFYILQDLNSSNGTFVNGERITQMTLHHNDHVTFGAVEFLFSNEASHLATGTSHDGGMSIVDIKDDLEGEASTSKAVISSSDMRDASSVFTSLEDAEADAETLRKMGQRLKTLYRLGEVMRDTLDEGSDETLQQVLDLVFDAALADRGVIMTKADPHDKDLKVRAVKYRDQPISPQRVSISRTILEEVMTKGVAVLSCDAQADDRFDNSESIIMNQIRSAVCVPLKRDEQVIGVIHLDTSTAVRSLTEDDLEFITMIAGELGIAMANATLRAEAAHRQRLAAVGETVAGISHNVKNILLLMQGGSELLNRSLEREDLEGANDSWGVVQRGIGKILRLVKDMLEYSSNKRPSLDMVDVNDLVCQIAEEVEEDLIQKGVALELDLQEDIGARPLDELGLQRTIMNLVVNSIEAIEHGEGSITVTTSVRDDPDRTLVITTSDNGMGIPPDKLERIFVPFFTTKGSGGTGLGLPMCRKVIEDMGGQMRVESEEGAGATFIMTIPLAEESGKLDTLAEE